MALRLSGGVRQFFELMRRGEKAGAESRKQKAGNGKL